MKLLLDDIGLEILGTFESCNYNQNEEISNLMYYEDDYDNNKILNIVTKQNFKIKIFVFGVIGNELRFMV